MADSNPQSARSEASPTIASFEVQNTPHTRLRATGKLFADPGFLGLAAVIALSWVAVSLWDLSSGLAASGNPPQHAISCNTVQAWFGDQATNTPGGRRIAIVATFPDSDFAMRTFCELTNQAPRVATLNEFGDCLWLGFPANEDSMRDEWLSKLKTRTENVLVITTNCPASFSLSWTSPSRDEANRIREELEGYFDTLPQYGLIPPWRPQDRRSAEERELHNRARRTYLALQRVQFVDDGQEGLNDLEQAIENAQRQGRASRAASLRAKRIQWIQAHRKTSLEQEFNGDRDLFDTKLADLFIAKDALDSSADSACRRSLEAMARLMGQLPNWNDQTPPIVDSFSAHAGVVTHDKLRINLLFATFTDPGEGAAALVHWLCQRGCFDLSYALHAGIGPVQLKGEAAGH